MTVKKLIEELSKYDENKAVFVNLPDEAFDSPVIRLEQTTIEYKEEEDGKVLDTEDVIIILYKPY